MQALGGFYLSKVGYSDAQTRVKTTNYKWLLTQSLIYLRPHLQQNLLIIKRIMSLSAMLFCLKKQSLHGRYLFSNNSDNLC